jgi:hypothetical protein
MKTITFDKAKLVSAISKAQLHIISAAEYIEETDSVAYTWGDELAIVSFADFMDIVLNGHYSDIEGTNNDNDNSN